MTYRQFLRAFRRTKTQWYVVAGERGNVRSGDGYIRCARGRCPIVSVARSLGISVMGDLDNGDVWYAADWLGLDDMDTTRIIEAADADPAADLHTRRALLARAIMKRRKR